VSSYHALACALGSAKASRAVGNALNRNPNPVVVPCHRVVRSDGGIGGYKRGAREKLRLLAREGVKVEGGRVTDFRKVFFDGFR
jgi:methylated-DNA-[protein]-cysteine S-methyltransferase